MVMWPQMPVQIRAERKGNIFILVITSNVERFSDKWDFYVMQYSLLESMKEDLKFGRKKKQRNF